MRKLFFVLSIVISTTAYSVPTFDKTETIHGVKLRSGKENSVRSYIGTIEKNFSYPLDIVQSGITNFSEKCNNSFKDKREYTSEDTNCKYHNENLVESIVIKDIKSHQESSTPTEQFVVGRRIYNRGSFGHYELVSISKGLNEKQQKTVTISIRMLTDKEARQLIEPKFSRESAFDKTTASFLLTEISPTETHLAYEYATETEHWILNKEISVPQVFSSMGRSIADLVKTIEDESQFQKRDLASKN